MSGSDALTLEDRQAILDVVSRYNWSIDHFDAEGWAETFTVDGVLMANGQERARGRAALTAYVAKRREAGGPSLRHWVGNLLITGDSTKARLQGYVMAYMVDRPLGAPYVMGEYDDELVKIDGAWKFKLRHMTVVAGQSATGR